MLFRSDIERACREQVTFIALSGDSAPHFTTFAGFVSILCDEIAYFNLWAALLFLPSCLIRSSRPARLPGMGCSHSGFQGRFSSPGMS